jgi:hypothetical protein
VATLGPLFPSITGSSGAELICWWLGLFGGFSTLYQRIVPIYHSEEFNQMVLDIENIPIPTTSYRTAIRALEVTKI